MKHGTLYGLLLLALLFATSPRPPTQAETVELLQLGRNLFERSLKIDPRNSIVREKYMDTLRQRWAGDLEQNQVG